MGEEGGIKIKSHISLFRELHPFFEMSRLNLVAVHKAILLKDRVAGMHVDLLCTGTERKHLVHVRK